MQKHAETGAKFREMRRIRKPSTSLYTRSKPEQEVVLAAILYLKSAICHESAHNQSCKVRITSPYGTA